VRRRRLRLRKGKILELFHEMERKHALHVRKFHLMKRFHAEAADINATFPANQVYETGPVAVAAA